MVTTARLKHPMIDQLIAYHRMRGDLERDYLGQWVIIYDSKLVGDGYESYDDAVEAARQRGLDDLECLIRRVGSEAYILSYGQ